MHSVSADLSGSYVLLLGKDDDHLFLSCLMLLLR